jgi:aryl-alcohol dehydrogenase-like predicted oxidoreductase
LAQVFALRPLSCAYRIAVELSIARTRAPEGKDAMTPSSISHLSRRDALCGALAAGAGAWLSSPALAASAPALPLITKAIPSSGEKLPAIGLGTDKFSRDEREPILAQIQRMQQLGGLVIDTAAAYGDSEELIGEALAGSRDRMFVATKLTASGGGFRGGGVGGQASFERSLMRLRTAKIDLLQVHNLDGVDALLPLMQQWKLAGKIRYIGITTSRVAQHEQMIEYLHKYPLDFVQVDYSLDNRDAAQTLLPLAAEKRVAVLANVPFGFGFLLRRAQSRKLPAWAADIDVTSWGQFLLKYVISHSAVTCAIPGSTQVAHLTDNQGAAHGRLPDEATRRRMEQYWDSAGS